VALTGCAGRYVAAPDNAAASGGGALASRVAADAPEVRRAGGAGGVADAGTSSSGRAGPESRAGRGAGADDPAALAGGRDGMATGPGGATGPGATAGADGGVASAAGGAGGGASSGAGAVTLDDEIAEAMAGEAGGRDGTGAASGTLSDRRDAAVSDANGGAVRAGPGGDIDAAGRSAGAGAVPGDIAMLDRDRAGGSGGRGAAGTDGAAGSAGSMSEAERARQGRVEAAANRIEFREGEKAQTLDGLLPMVLAMNENGMFEFDRYELDDDVRASLDQLAAKLSDAPYERLVVTGFTDRIGNAAYNQTLSEKRAWAVAGYLMEKGVPPVKLKVEGRGERDAVTDFEACRGLKRAEMIDCLQRDRRVEVVATVREYETTGKD
jgi:outer membrane protein OmpA-like peptidoglycan-associated protein